MKNIRLHCFTILALFGLAVHVHADFLTPRLPAPAIGNGGSGPVPALVASTLTVTSVNDDGPGSLRQAISNAAAGDTIQFALGKPFFHLPATILLRSSLTIDKDLTILGPGPEKLIVARTFAKRTPSFRVLDVNAGVVTLAGVTIINGRALNPDGQSDNLGGAILNYGTLTVSNCVITKNEVPTEGGGIGYGGGIFSIGSLTILNSTVSNNDASGAGGGISAFYSPRFFLSGSTFNDNFAGVQAGGINLQATTGHIINCTISDNKVDKTGVASGLLLLGFAGETAGLALSSTTITDNEGDTNGAVVIAGLAGNAGVSARLINTLVADNEPRNFSLAGTPTLQSLGHNLDSDGSSQFANAVNGDIIGTEAFPVDARLGKLKWNGGPTKTHALKIGSPAIDGGDCQDAFGAALAVDQRGFPRPQGAACDIGAYENQPPTITCPEITTIDCKDDIRVTVNDPDGDALSVVWNVDGAYVQTNSVSAEHPPEEETVKLKMSLSSGVHTILVMVADGKGPAAQCSTTITVQDTKAPKIKSIKATPKSLWPATNQLVDVTLQVKVEDCSPVQSRIVSVKSNQAAGTAPDWIITGDLTLQLRSTRTGNRDRTYTITVEATDTAGKTDRDTVSVKVSKNKPDKDDDDDHNH